MWVVIVLVLVIVVIAVLPFVRTAPGRKELSQLEIADVDFTKLRDGSFDGRYKGNKDNFRDVSVEVKISSGALTKIKIKRDALKKQRQRTETKYTAAVDTLFRDVIREQSLKVDTVSGATLTCKAHLKAVEDALEKAKVKE